MSAPGQLSANHLKQLRDGSGISDEVIAERGYVSVTQRTTLRGYGFSVQQCTTVPGILIPQHGTDGSNGRYTFKPDQPRVTTSKRSGKPREIKYENPKGQGLRLDCPPRCQKDLGNPAIELWITEGSKKADAGASHGLCIIALNGVNGFIGKNQFGAVTALADWNYIALKGRIVNVCFDSDAVNVPEVRQALDRLVAFLNFKGAYVNVVYLPKADDGSKVGIDDYLLKHSVLDLQSLIQAPRPAPTAAPPQFELLDMAPATISRPLSLLNNLTHTAIWPYARRTITETINKNGQIERHSPPLERVERELMIIRSDGAIFGGGHRDLTELDAEIHLSEIPLDSKLWSTPGIKKWLGGQRPQPADVFNRIVDVIDRFIDFDRSLADQREMCEMVACYILATWFLDAFNVMGYLWPNGEPGSGKTQLLVILAELGYLGQFILAAGSFAALRDLADYGALLCFDDAENFSDPKTTDPDKRMMLLAGNRRGSTVPVKEQSPNGTWQTRYVHTYCPRSFSATRLPDRILASRSITIPLVRSGDQKRANADPAEYGLWPHPRRELLDDLWALATTHMPALSAYERRINEDSNLMGRTLEPWRAILAVALWLEENGVKDLSVRIRKVSGDYQVERADFETDDLTRLVVSAVSALFAVCALLPGTPPELTLQTAEITQKVQELAKDDETGIDPEKINSKRVGWILKRLRLRHAGRKDGKGPKQWVIKSAEIEKLRNAFSLFDRNSGGVGNETAQSAPNCGNCGNSDPEGDIIVAETSYPAVSELDFGDTYDGPNVTPEDWVPQF